MASIEEDDQHSDKLHTRVPLVLTLPVILLCLFIPAKCLVQVSPVVVYVSCIGVYTSCREEVGAGFKGDREYVAPSKGCECALLSDVCTHAVQAKYVWFVSR